MASLTPRIDRLQKNYLINGDMRIAQRGTSFAAIANTAYSLDRWRYAKSGAMVHTVTQDTDVPTLAQAGYLFQNSYRANLTTPDTSIAAGDYCLIQQFVEGYNWAHLAQKPVTLSFWVKATLAGTYCVSIRSSGTDRSFVAQYTIDTTNTWERKVIQIEASPSSGTWNYTNGIGANISWAVAVGSTYHTTAGSWQSGDFFGTSSQVNGTNTGATDFRLTGIMLSEGHLTDPEFSTFGKDFQAETKACQRYYEKSYDLTTNPGTVTAAGGWLFSGPVSAPRRISTPMKVRKRVAPAVVFYSTATGATGVVNRDSSGDTAININVSGETHIGYEVSSFPAGEVRSYVQWTADSEL